MGIPRKVGGHGAISREVDVEVGDEEKTMSSLP